MNKLAILVGGVSSLAVIALGIYAWISLGDVTMTANGYVALFLGVIITAALGGALMVLVFYSSRTGFDDRVAGAARNDKLPSP